MFFVLLCCFSSDGEQSAPVRLRGFGIVINTCSHCDHLTDGVDWWFHSRGERHPHHQHNQTRMAVCCFLRASCGHAFFDKPPPPPHHHHQRVDQRLLSSTIIKPKTLYARVDFYDLPASYMISRMLRLGAVFSVREHTTRAGADAEHDMASARDAARSTSCLHHWQLTRRRVRQRGVL